MKKVGEKVIPLPGISLLICTSQLPWSLWKRFVFQIVKNFSGERLKLLNFGNPYRHHHATRNCNLVTCTITLHTFDIKLDWD